MNEEWHYDIEDVAKAAGVEEHEVEEAIDSGELVIELLGNTCRWIVAKRLLQGEEG